MLARTDESTFKRIASGFEEMAKQEIVIAPWLAMNDGEERLSDALRFQLKKHSRDLAAAYSDSDVFWIHKTLTPGFLERAFYETLLSTAAYLSYMRLGTLIITEEMVSVSQSLLRNHLDNTGSSALLSVYTRVIAYLNNQFVLYYGEVSEDVFISGAWHRPWTDYSLEHEMETAIHYGFMERIDRDGERLIRLTEAGEELYRECRSDLEKCGYIQQREQLMRSSNFTNMEDYEQIMKRSIPKISDYRGELIDWSEIRPGMEVLELGCGAGALTLDAGLYERIGMHGSVIATDPSIGMLERAKVKLRNYSATNTQFKQAAAEQLPFPNNSFDAVIGMLFLHFTDIPKALAEIKRVTKPGGIFTSISGLRIDKGTDFFSEWFEPVFRMGLISNSSSEFPDEDYLPNVASDYFHSFDCKVQNWHTDLSNVEHIVSFLVKAGTMAELSELPWSARDVLFKELIDKGYEVKAKYGSEVMKRIQPVQWFKGTVGK